MKKLAFLVVIFIAFTLQSYSQIAVIVNKGVAVSSISKDDLKAVYSLDSKRLGGTALKLFDNSNTGLSSKFYSYLGTSKDAMKKIWLKAKLTGKGAPPSEANDADIVAKVASTPGAIGYVDASKVTGDVKVILTI